MNCWWLPTSVRIGLSASNRGYGLLLLEAVWIFQWKLFINLCLKVFQLSLAVSSTSVWSRLLTVMQVIFELPFVVVQLQLVVVCQLFRGCLSTSVKSCSFKSLLNFVCLFQWRLFVNFGWNSFVNFRSNLLSSPIWSFCHLPFKLYASYC